MRWECPGTFYAQELGRPYQRRGCHIWRDDQGRAVLIGERAVELFRLLLHAGDYVPSRDLSMRMYGHSTLRSADRIRFQVKVLRKFIDDIGLPFEIENRIWHGYRIIRKT